MRNISPIIKAALANTGPMVGEFQPVTRVTVEPGWYLNQTSGTVGTRPLEKLPVRWWQAAGNPQFPDEVELPPMKSIVIDRSLTQPAGTIELTMYNTFTPTDGVAHDSPDAFGRPGMYSYARGLSSDALARWGQHPNQWKNLFRENALLRVYSGYGGQTLSLGDAINAGNVMLVGVFLVDNVVIESGTSGGLITLNGRDMAKLLIDQFAWPPTIPQAFYTNAGIEYYYTGGTVTPGVTAAQDQIFPAYCQYLSCSGTTGDDPIDGHVPSSCTDANPGADFYLSEAKPLSNPAVCPTITFTVNSEISAVWVTCPPGLGGYTCYVGIHQSSGWVATGGTFQTHDYVMSFAVHDTNGWIDLPTTYQCDTMILIFDNLPLTDLGTGFDPYRAAVNSVQTGLNGLNILYPQGSTDPGITVFAPRVEFKQNYSDYCVDEATEALTRRGWMKWDEVLEGDLVLGMDPKTRTGQWHPVSSVYRRRHANTPMVRFKGASLDALTTPNHRWFTRYQRQGRMRWTTSDAFTTSDRIPLAVRPDHLPTVTKHSDSFVELIAWFWTEGSWSPYAAQLSQSVKANPANTDKITRTLTTLYGEPGPIPRGPSSGNVSGPWWNIYERPDGVHLFNLSKRVADELREICDADKVVSIDFINTLTASQLELFISRSLLADGACNKERRGALSDEYVLGEDSERITQVHEGRIRSFEYACVLAGLPVTTHQRMTKRGPMWSTTMLKCDETTPLRRAGPIATESYQGVVWCPQTKLGNFIARRNGSIYLTGNSQIADDFLQWAGFHLGGDVPADAYSPTFGHVEYTGAYDSLGPIPASTWDKKSIMDCIQVCAQIVGFIFRIGERGEAWYASPNWWSPGNYGDENNYSRTFPILDESVNLTDFIQTTSDASMVSEIIVSPLDPYAFNNAPGDVTVTRFVPPNIGGLHGINKPCMIGIPLNVPVSINDQAAMAELLAVQCYMAMRQGQATAKFDPSITPDTQIKIYDRVTGDSNIHYVTGVHTEHDLDTGTHLATYTTYWLGDDNNWVINASNNTFLAGSVLSSTTYNDQGMVASTNLVNFLKRSGSSRLSQFTGGSTNTANLADQPVPFTEIGMETAAGYSVSDAGGRIEDFSYGTVTNPSVAEG